MNGESVDFLDWACPGVLPVLNPEPVKLAVRTARAFSSRLAQVLRFDRKHYEHHDLPLGYQITQNRHPLASGGAIRTRQGAIPLRQIHLEQDTARTVDGRLDLRRCGAALVEIVTEPFTATASDCARVCRRLSQIVCDAGVSEGRLQEGNIRFDINLSEPNSPLQASKRVEVKNVNSYQYIEMAMGMVRFGEHAGQTLLFDQGTRRVAVMRSKQAYRFLPEPDLPEMEISHFSEPPGDLPSDRLEFIDAMSLSEQERTVLEGLETGKFRLWHRFATQFTPKFAFSWIIGELQRVLNYSNQGYSDRWDEQLVDILKAVNLGIISRQQAKLLLQKMVANEPIIINDGSIDTELVIRDILRANPNLPTHALLGKVLQQCPGNPADILQKIEEFKRR